MTLPADLAQAIERLGDVTHLLVAMDFDGTMAPFVDRPEDARALPAAAAALEELAGAPGTTAALLSGRDLASLRHAASPGPAVLLVGSHGGQRWAPDSYGADGGGLELSDGQHELLREVRARLGEVAARHPGAALEAKPAGVVLHVRTCAPAVAAAALAEGRTALEELDGVVLTDGKAVLESSVIHATKGAGLEWLRQLAGADAVLFAGDDVTDERAFEVLRPGDVGVKIGSGETAARFRLDGTGDVPALLQTVLRVRRL
ncbi:trehalose-phosphatase [Zafaria sp. Z1313]|uniref:trehalose-phosphatase n=1 Tax=unclassified Zafaria TaxID=2828765 RepID=UPI002E779F31|nr:trehalose-phosphatase [Zafaria sp. J156]MEE1622426.1 trehalose-phosphatase [Zafaria sp. J156]